MIVWRKSSRTGGNDADKMCVEVASLAAGAVGVRDSKNPHGPYLSISLAAFGRLVQQLKDQ